MGRVGTVVAAGLASSGHNVMGVDVDHERVAALHGACPPFYEPELAERLALALERGTLRVLHRDQVTEDLGEVAVITVGTPPDRGYGVDLRQVREEPCPGLRTPTLGIWSSP